ncbi:MAG TPA: hypothetical protein VNQ73_15275 [Ilumatobacter sp.]|nr:hypothetical protein [Ilumatobacter sp.]
MRRIIAIGSIAIGLFLIASPLVLRYPAKTSGVETMTRELGPLLTEPALAQTRADIETLNAFAAELQQEAIPHLAGALAEAGAIASPADFEQFAAGQYPDLAAGLAGFDTEILPHFNGLVDAMEANRVNFEKADAIPTTWMPATTLTPMLVILGVVATALGILAWKRRSLSSLVPIGVLGAVIVVVTTLVLQLPDKTAATDDLSDAFRPMFTEESLATSRALAGTAAAAGVEFSRALPEMAAALGAPPEQFAASLSAQFPAVGAAMQDFDDIVGRFGSILERVEANAESFRLADQLPTAGTSATLVTWHLLAPGLTLCALGIAGAAAARRGDEPSESGTEPVGVPAVAGAGR